MTFSAAQIALIINGKIAPFVNTKIDKSVNETPPQPIAIPATGPALARSPRWPYALGAAIFAIVTVYFLRRLIISRTG